MTKLKTLREQTGRLQTDIASEVGITREYLSSLENGRRSLTRSLAEKLAAVYGVSPAELLGYQLPEREHVLENDWSFNQDAMDRLRREHAQELQAALEEAQTWKAKYEDMKHSRDFAESMCEMLKKQVISLEEKLSERENA